jgi:alanine dehydrogenase
VMALADKGWERACREDHSLALGLNAHAGALTNGPVAAAHAMEATPLDDVLSTGAPS